VEAQATVDGIVLGMAIDSGGVGRSRNIARRRSGVVPDGLNRPDHRPEGRPGGTENDADQRSRLCAGLRVRSAGLRGERLGEASGQGGSNECSVLHA
jgi:hypothetical protein